MPPTTRRQAHAAARGWTTAMVALEAASVPACVADVAATDAGQRITAAARPVPDH